MKNAEEKNQAITRNVAKSSTMERSNCHKGTTPNGILASITIGDVKGIIEAQKERALLGCSKVCSIMNKPTTSGIVTGSCN